MAIKDIDTKCWILALFVRDDGQRFLLGDGSYEFEEKQLHFVANAMANDVVEVQGNDGYLLAGQVRRPSTQSFDGYVGDSSTSKAMVEERRRAFFAFFRKNHFYKVIYVFPDGSAIQRKRGFLVDAPEVKEMWQIYPKYHVALNFEDINYYYYDENADGEEIYGKSATISLNSAAQTGGLIWAEPGRTSISEEGTNFTVPGTLAGGTLSSLQLKGDTMQQTYSGKNLINNYDLTYDYSNVETLYNTLTTLPTGIRYKTTYIEGGPFIIFRLLDLTPYKNKVIRMRANFGSKGGISMVLCDSGVTTRNVVAETMTSGAEISYTVPNDLGNTPYLAYRLRIYPATGNDTVDFTDLILTIDNVDMTYEPYVGGIAAPNPDYPQEVQTVTGRQVVIVSGKNMYVNSQDFSGSGWTHTSGWTTDSSTYNGLVVKKKTGAWNGIGKYLNVEAGKTYTFSVFAKADSARNVTIYIRENPGATVSPTEQSISLTTIWQRFSVTFTATTSGSVRPRVENTQAYNDYAYICGYQLEEGPAMTDYEEYVTQDYEVNLGKNLFDKSNISWYRNNNGAFSDTSDTSTTRIRTNSFPIAGGKTYTISGIPTDITLLAIRTYAVEGGPQTTAVVRDGNTFTFSDDTRYIHLLFSGINFSSATNTLMANADIQLELGSTATSYAPYFTPIELCKIGDYQDRIYKSGDDWYIHKNIVKKIFDGTEEWTVSSSWWSSDKNYYGAFCYFSDLAKLGAENEYNYALFCDNLSETQTTAMIKGGLAEGIKQSGGNSDQYIAIGLSKTRLSDVSSGYNTRQSIKAWLGTNNTIVYGVLATATDTQITNTALIAQLNALAAATTYNGSTSFTVDGNGNLAAILSIELEITGGGGVLWDENGAVWEEGKPSYSIVTVDAIDNVYPVLTITGRTVDPIITDVTTGMAFEYSGTITESQVLRIDMFNKTATLNGTSVVGNVTGDWLYLAPGNNKITYTANNADAPNATLEWQEIVG